MEPPLSGGPDSNDDSGILANDPDATTTPSNSEPVVEPTLELPETNSDTPKGNYYYVVTTIS